MNRTRPKQIVIRLSDHEYQILKTKVAQSGKKQQDYLIEAIIEGRIVNLDELKTIVPELKRQGNNLNQIARALNARCENVSISDVQEVLKEVNEIWQLLKQYLLKQA